MVETSIVVPTYNERSNIGELLTDVSRAISGADSTFEVLVIDDDSPDGTARLAREKAGAVEVDVRVVVRRDQPDLARSILRGLSEAGGEVVVVMDADLQHPPEVVPELADTVSPETPIAIGTRYNDAGGIENWPGRRRLVSLGALVLAMLLVPPARGTSDPISGFFAVSADALDVHDLSPDGYKILLGVLTHVDPTRVAEVGFVFRNRRQGDSSLNAEQFVRFLNHSFRCGVRYRRRALDEWMQRFDGSSPGYPRRSKE